MQEFKQCNQQEVHQYIKTILNPFLQPMVYHLVLKRFDNPVTAAIQWLSKYSKNNLLKVCRAQSQQLSELDDQNKEQVKQLEQKIKKNRINRNHFKNRPSFSEQSFGMFNHPKSIVKQDTIQISEDQMKLIKPLLSNSILFETLDYKDEQIIFQSIKIKKAQEFEIIIKQGQEGNLLYIVQSGQYDCYKLINEENILVKTYYPGQTFGDLALMYNSPRSATIVTKKPGKLLTLDRSTFSRILKVAAMRKQSTILNTIKSLKFSIMVPQDQIHQLVHIFKEEKFIEGEYILRKGQISNKLYVVLEGTIAEESKESNQKFNQLNGEGTLFNENGFWNNGCVDVNIKAVTLTKVGVLSCTQFKRVFGSIWDQLRIKK